MEDKYIPLLVPMALEEFLERIRVLVREELKRNPNENIYETPGLIAKPIYKAKEVCCLLSISRQTLNIWQREGILKPHKIKSRVFFLKSDIDKLINDKDST